MNSGLRKRLAASIDQRDLLQRVETDIEREYDETFKQVFKEDVEKVAIDFLALE